MRIDTELFDICRDFIKDNNITCSEDIYQSDKIQNNSLELIELMCELIGYHEDEDEIENDWDESDTGC